MSKTSNEDFICEESLVKKKPEIEYDDKAFREGYSAGLTGGFSDDNPYPKGRECVADDRRSLSWTSGFIEGKAERAAAKSEGRPMRVHQYRPIPEGKD